MKRAKQNQARTVLVTAGPTRAYLDDVRFLSNYSSGVLGFKICRELVKKKIKVIAIVGATSQKFESLRLHKLIKIETADEMHRAVLDACRTFHPETAIFNAAVLDFQPSAARKGKVSSARKTWTLRLVPTKKIIDDVGKNFPHVKRVGFKLEPKALTESSRTRFAQAYLKKKGLRALCLNYLDEVSPTKHRAYLYEKGRCVILSGKDAIARKLAELTEAGWDSER